MTPEMTKAFVKAFFEKYYAKQRAKNTIYVERPGVPAVMLDDNADPAQEWNIWKLSAVAESEYNIPKIEQTLGMALPESIKAFFTTYHHFFGYPLGDNRPNAPFWEFDRAYNSTLCKAGYLPFAWRDDYFILCMDLTNMPIEECCPILCIDSEVLWNLADDWAEQYFDPREDTQEEPVIPPLPKAALVPVLRPVSDSFYAFLEDVLNGVFDKHAN